MQQIATLPKPPGFAPGDMAGPPLRLRLPGPDGQPIPGPPPAQYGSTNSDLAFSGNLLFVGNYNGINFYDIDNPMKIKLRTSVVCPGGQGDVSVYGICCSCRQRPSMGASIAARRAFRCRPVTCRHRLRPLRPPPPAARPRGVAPSAAAAEPGPVPRRPHLRYQRPLESEAGGRRTELPRFAHPFPADRSQGQGQRLHLYLRHGRTSGRRRNWRSARAAQPEDNPEYGAIPHRHHQGPAGASGTREDRIQPAHLRRCARPEP